MEFQGNVTTQMWLHKTIIFQGPRHKGSLAFGPQRLRSWLGRQDGCLEELRVWEVLNLVSNNSV